MRKLLTLICLISLLTNSVKAEDHIFETYGVEQGLLHMYVYSISQDSSGFIWIGTNDGAFRFDGIEFDYYTVEEGLSENFITKIFTDSKGRVWFGHQSGTVSLMQDGRCNPFILEDDLHGAVMGFHEDEKGRIWILVQNLGLIKLDTELNQQTYKFAEDEPTLSCISSVGDGFYLLGTHEQLYLGLLDETSSTFINPSPVTDYPGSKVSDILTLFDGSYIIISKEEGIYNLVLDKNSGLYIVSTINANEDGSLDNLEEGILLDSGDFLVSSMGSGIMRFSKNTSGKYVLSEAINTKNGLISDNIKSIFQDGQGNLWFGMYGEGLSKKVRNNFSFYSLSNKGQGSVYAISAHENGMLVSMDEKLLILDEYGNIARTIPLPEKLKHDRITSLFMAPNGDHYLGFEINGLYLYTGPDRNLKKIQLSNNRLSNAVNHISGDEEFLWISTKHGLCRIELSSGKKKWYTSNDGLPYNSIQATFIDSKKRVFLATIASYLPYIDSEGELKKMGESSNGSTVAITSVFEDSQGHIWLCTEGEGLWRFNEDGFSRIGEVNGLFSNYCYSISERKEGKLLIGHRGAMSELDADGLNIKIYGKKDGINTSTEFYPGAVFVDKKNNTWFGTSNGLIQSASNPKKQKSLPPILNIKSLYIDGEEQALWEVPFHLRKGTYEIRIEYCGINYQDPGNISYQSMLEGYSFDWSPTGKQRQVIYNRVNHGSYKFHLRAFDGSGQSSELCSSDLFIIEKAFYTRSWFFILGVLFIAFLFFMTVKLTGLKLKNEQNRLRERLNEKSKEIIVKEEIIKERKRVEKILLDAKTNAEMSEKLKTAFLRNMSHEIRTPMNAIQGFSNLLKEEELTTEDRNNYIELINENSQSLLNLIDDILDVSRLEAKQIDLSIKKCDLRKLMSSLEISTKILLDKANKNGIEIVLSIPSEGNHFIETDENRFKQVFMKLLDNAVKFTEKGSISFGYKFENGNICFFVKDTGIGLSADKFDVIFDHFRKETESKLQLYSGTGIGLTIARHLTRLLGGNIFVESEPGKGSVFSFVLPRKAGKIVNLSSENRPSVPLAGRWKKKKILIVEDTDSNFLLLENLLRPTGVNIEWADDGESALEKYFKEDGYHLVIMDIKLPGIDGYETTRRIRDKDDQINIMAYSAYAMKTDQEKILKSGFNAYIVKPSHNDIILTEISKLLD